MSKSQVSEQTIKLPDGTIMRLSDLPLSAFTMSCGHQARFYGVIKGDLYFCEECGEHNQITHIVS